MEENINLDITYSNLDFTGGECIAKTIYLITYKNKSIGQVYIDSFKKSQYINIWIKQTSNKELYNTLINYIENGFKTKEIYVYTNREDIYEHSILNELNYKRVNEYIYPDVYQFKKEIL